ncbi:TonB-dependent receptor [Salinisphaera sp. Q1T1-3]|uniref:TonB-dependent receptor n=1 Tax=Salinisphaera sp. Q1T1-3 TaxID=2321229 RepID=UPI0013149EB7|nr:TonB-dependent receptor [Salinisphaera sp. Q1T1-3]
MKTGWGGFLFGAAAGLCGPGAAMAQAPAAAAPSSGATQQLAPVTVTGQRDTASQVTLPLAPETVDTAAAMKDVPGGAVSNNGGVSGQTQFRGLSGYRNQVNIDGMGIASGGPNWMDPPLHYAPAALVDTLSVTRGIPSVADSIDAIGTTIDATTKGSRFTEGDNYVLHGFGESTVRSVDDGYSLTGQANLSNDHNRLGVTVSTDQAGGERTPYGVLRASAYDRKQYGLNFGHRGRLGETSGFVRAQRTGDSGNPDLPLDIDFFHTWLGELKQDFSLGDWRMTAQLDGNHVEHRMDNYLMRPTPDFSPLNGAAPDPRYIRARSQRYATKLHAAHDLAGGTFKAGFDGSWAQHDAFVGNPDNPMFRVDAFSDIRRDTYSGFAQWAGRLDTPSQGLLSDRWHGELGVRYTRVQTAAGPGGVAPSLPMPAQRLASRFADADRDQTDNNVDVVAKLARDIGQRWQAKLALARKTRSPYYLERYAYIPLEASAGAADGNNVIGRTTLNPETAYMVDLGLDFTGSRLSVSPAAYYHRINDYIDPTPYTGGDADVARVSNVNGDSTPLQYSNIEAEIYGADIDARYALTDHWHLDGGGGYTRGRRTDTHDSLYRIAPGNLRGAVSWQSAQWTLRLAERYVFAQHHTADYRRDARVDDPATGGYALTDVSARYRATGNAWVEVGVENLLNRGYRDYMSGFNRAGDSAVPVGARLPGAGRNAYATLHVSF